MCRWLNDKFPGQGLLPTRLNRNKGSFAGMRTYTMGANADSYYEYLLKMWLLKQQKVVPPVLLLLNRQAQLSCNPYVGTQLGQSD